MWHKILIGISAFERHYFPIPEHAQRSCLGAAVKQNLFTSGLGCKELISTAHPQQQPCLHIEAIDSEGVKKEELLPYSWLTCLSGLLCLQENNEGPSSPTGPDYYAEAS